VSATATALAAPDERTRRRRELHDVANTILLSLAAILTAWAAFQAAAWSDEQAKTDEEAIEVLARSVRATSTAGSFVVVDVITFTDWLADVRREHAADPSQPLPGPGYVPAPGSDSEAAQRVFRAEFRPAFEAWLETDPFVDPNAPPVPFAVPEYRLAEDRAGFEEAERATRLHTQSDEDAETARAYLSVTVVYAIVLAITAIGLKVGSDRAREIVLAVASVVLVAATAYMLTQPITF
jgi:hypothetical protein